MSESLPKVFCAIDTPDKDTAIRLAQMIGPVTGSIKLGLEFFNAQGPDGVRAVLDSAPGLPLFLDLKFHDIPNTVAAAVAAVSERLRPLYLNVHASGGAAMMRTAKESCAAGTKLLGVTVLTSLGNSDLSSIGQAGPAAEQVRRLALLAQDSGLDGVVCSGHDIKALRQACGPDFILMVPGIRPAGTDAGDQKRVMTPSEALDAGATHLVIGRPITGSQDPKAAAAAIMQDLKKQ